MFANFEKAFFKKNEMDDKIPAEVLTSLGQKRNLPDGLMYADVGNGACAVFASDTEKMNLKGFNVEIPNDLPKNFEPTNFHEVMEFMYRTQRKLKVKTSKEKVLSLNGKQIHIEDLVQFPLKEAALDEFELFLDPAPFPPPFTVSLEGNGVVKQFSMQRQPYPDMNKTKFKSINNPAFEISYILNESNRRLTFTFKYNIEHAKDSTEVIEILKLYQACAKQDFKLQGHPFPPSNANETESKSIAQIINFWEKIRALEDVLQVTFIPSSKPDRKDVFNIEKLYRSLVEKRPFKEYVNITDFTLDVSPGFNGDELLNEDGIVLHYSNREEVKVLGVELDLYNIKGYFNFRITHMEPLNAEKSKYRLFVKPLKEKRIFQSTFMFKTEAEMTNYMSNITTNSNTFKLQEAEELSID